MSQKVLQLHNRKNSKIQLQWPSGIFILLFFFLIGCGESDRVSGQAKKETGEQHLKKDTVLNSEGLNFFSEGNYLAAIMKFEEAAKLNPAEPEYPNNIGVSQMQLSQLDTAEIALRKAVSLNDKNALYHENLGLVLLKKGSFSEALKSYKNALEINPDSFSALFYQGLAFYSSNNMEGAKKSWEAADRIKPDAETKNNLGMVLLNQGDAIKAKSYFEDAIKINNNHHMANYNLGVVYQQYLNDLSKSSYYYEKSIHINPSYFAVYLNLGIVYNKMGKKSQARNALEEFLRLAPPTMSGPINDAKNRLQELAE